MLLRNKVAVIYGASGAIGGTVARAFASEGARVFLTARRLAPVDALAHELVAAGGTASAAQVDAQDEAAMDRHLDAVVAQAGRVDVSFNAVGYPTVDILGVPHMKLASELFTAPIVAYTRSYFLTARLAARRMALQKSGVIMTVSAIPARNATAMNGGYGPALAAKDALTRDLSLEFAPLGIRVVGLRPHALPETPAMRSLYEIKAKPAGATWEQFQSQLTSLGHVRRAQKVEELGNLAAFMASDRASAMTGTTVNLTMGAVAD